MASVRWTLGAAPVWNRLSAEANGSAVTFRAWPEPGEPPARELVYQAPADIASEDLAFWPGRGLFLGSQGAILNSPAPDASFAKLNLKGEEIYSPVGIAFGLTGDLYVSENVNAESSAVKLITPSGMCSILSHGFGREHFSLPNDIAVDGSGQVYVAATCNDMIYRISPVNGETTESVATPGPNGLAFSDDYTYLYFTIENPALFCHGLGVQGGLFRVPIGLNGAPGHIETLAKDFAVVGDGLTFDVEGNLYVVFTLPLVNGKPRLTSGVYLYTPDGSLNEFFSVNLLQGDIITNVAFGIEPFDPYSLYCYGFTGKLYKVKVGIRGRPLP
jgi:sugar lactone lactonase YvrE